MFISKEKAELIAKLSYEEYEYLKTMELKAMKTVL